MGRSQWLLVWSMGAWVGVRHVGLDTAMLPTQADLTLVLLAMGSH